MRARSRYLGPLAVAALLSLGACGGGSTGEATAEQAPGSMTGVVATIEPPEGDIESFELVRPGEDAQRIYIDPELDYGFDLQHLHEHMADEGPVKVSLEEREGRLYATSIEDA